MRYKPDEEEELLIIERITIFFAPRFEKRTCNPSVEKYIFIRRSYSFFLSKNRKFAGRKWPRREEKSVAFVGRRSIENIGATPSRFLEGLGLSGEG